MTKLLVGCPPVSAKAMLRPAAREISMHRPRFDSVSITWSWWAQPRTSGPMTTPSRISKMTSGTLFTGVLLLVHLVLRVLLAAIGWGLLDQAGLWAGAAAIALASLSLVVNFLYLPYQPWWALIGIAMGLFAIWSLAQSTTDRPGVKA